MSCRGPACSTSPGDDELAVISVTSFRTISSATFRGLGKSGSMIKATEKEPDQLGLELAWAAGYDIAAAILPGGASTRLRRAWNCSAPANGSSKKRWPNSGGRRAPADWNPASASHRPDQFGRHPSVPRYDEAESKLSIADEGRRNVRFKGIIVAAASVALITTPAMAAASASSQAAQANVQSESVEGMELRGGFVIPLIAVIAIILGILAATNNGHDRPASP